MPTWYRPRVLRTDKKPLSEKSLKHLADFDSSIVNPKTAAELSLKSLRRPLAQVPRSERGVEWTERVVLAYCIKGLRSARVRSLRKSISAYWASQEQHTKAQDFEARVHQILRSEDLGDKSYFVDFYIKESKPAAEELKEIVTVLQRSGIEVFVNSGTLLGAIRHQDFLKHDDDIDLGVIMKSSDDRQVAKEMVCLHQRLSSSIDLPIKTCFRSPVLKIKLKSDIVVDLFPTWVRDDRVYVWPHTFGELEKSSLFPLRSVSIAGQDFPAPADPEKMLVLNYGSNWLTPDPHFVFPWRQAREKFKIVLKAYRYAVIIYAVRKKLWGDRKK